MNSRRQEKINSLLKDIAAAFLSREATGSLVTITRVETLKDLKSAEIFISIFPEDKEKEALNLLNEKKGELRKFIGSQIKMKFLPHLEFKIDETEKSRQKIEKILGQVAK